MAVGKPDFDLNSFGVKYLSKDQVQDFLEIKKFGKNIGDTPDPVEEKRDKDGNIIQVKPHPQKGEVFTDIKGLNAHQNPTPIDGGGFPGKWRRTGKKDKDGNPIKYQQSKDGTKPKVGQVPTSRKNDVQYGDLGQESASEVRESFDMITNSPKYQEEIHRDAPLTTEQGTEKFDDTPANRALRDRIAAREHKKKLAAEKKKKLKKANDIIMDMNIMKLNLMKDALDGTGKNTPEFGRTGHMGMNYQPQHKEGQAVEARIARQDSDKRELPYEQRSRMNVFDKKPKGKPPVKKPYKNNQPDSRIPENKLTEKERNRIITTGLGDASDPNDKNPYIGGHGAPSDLKRKAAETIFKAISLKLDLMKDAPKDLEREGIKKKPSNMPKAGKRDFEITPDQEEAARRGDFGNRITGHDEESAITRLSDSERDWKAGHENAYGTRPINNPEGELIPPSVQNQRMGSTTNMKDEN